ncbi:hypothetical protein HXX76_008278 [Chlamydomonas incerta]|uniref:Uncharacterized protein n=1 Tax=Chlamydomonas incerta TaxID=51695 RepID=A0A835T989_CHLIN|nr:hypothetical protein HXX76_008278 [Chlamydomonas incerta]|eukprot:KAG2433926.1 hypothetical protein HXX76_008278 [Chlamydomonas incerta]
MDANLLQQREQLRTALSAYGADVKRFQDIDLDKLWNSRYCSVDALQEATREGLTAAELPPGLVDHISVRKGRVTSATGLGTEGAAAAGSLPATAGNNAISSAPGPAHQGGQQVGASAAPIADAQPPVTMAALMEAMERQAATMTTTVKEALEGQAATMTTTVKEALEGQAATLERQAATLERQAATMTTTVKEALEGQAATLERQAATMTTTVKEALEGQAATLERQAATMTTTVKEALEGQAATLEATLERQAATMTTTVKEALEGQAATLEATLKGALPDNRAARRFPVSTVDWNQLERDWAVYLTEVPTKTKVS